MATNATSAEIGAYKAASVEYASKLLALESLPDGYTNDRADALAEELTEAENRLIKTPSPDISGIIDKLQLAWRDGNNAIPEHRAYILQDLIRLSGASNMPAIGFDAALWVRNWTKAGGGMIVRNDELVLLAPTGSEGHDLDSLKYELDVTNGRSAVRAQLSVLSLQEAAE